MMRYSYCQQADMLHKYGRANGNCREATKLYRAYIIISENLRRVCKSEHVIPFLQLIVEVSCIGIHKREDAILREVAKDRRVSSRNLASR